MSNFSYCLTLLNCANIVVGFARIWGYPVGIIGNNGVLFAESALKVSVRTVLRDYILTENDITERNILPDGTAPTSWTIDLHYPDEENAKKFEQPFRSIAKHIAIYPYPIPFRCFYSKNINNLMMAGRNISVSHVALGTIRLMRTGGMMGEVVGMAASICKEKSVQPRDIYQKHFADLEKLMQKGVGDPNLPNIQKYNLGGTLMETKKK